MADGTHGPAPDTEEVEVVATDTPTFDETWNIWQRISAVMSVVGFIEPDKEMKIGKGIGYISHDMVAAKLRRAFLLYGIAVYPTVTHHNKDGNRTELTITVAVVNIHNPEDNVKVESIGYGVDDADKGPGKAFSYAVKYALMKLFMLNSADDIEDDDLKHDPEKARASDVTAAKVEVAEAQKSFATSFKANILAAESVDEINALQKEHKAALLDLPDTTREFFVELIEKRKEALAELGGELPL